MWSHQGMYIHLARRVSSSAVQEERRHKSDVAESQLLARLNSDGCGGKKNQRLFGVFG